MEKPIDLPNELEGFSGTVPLFPLPNLVLFPHIAQPLHIFEPRYREMMEDALAGERLFGMALLKPGYKENYHTKQPEIHPMVCVGKITEYERLPDGRFNLMLKGLSRAYILTEVENQKEYRSAEVQLVQILHDLDYASEHFHVLRLQELFKSYVSSIHQDYSRLIPKNLPLNELCDVISYVLKFDHETAQKILSIWKMSDRVGALTQVLESCLPQYGVNRGPVEYKESLN